MEAPRVISGAAQLARELPPAKPEHYYETQMDFLRTVADKLREEIEIDEE